jgi:hypothetical protein
VNRPGFEFLSSPIDDELIPQDESTASQWNADELRQGLPSCFSATSDIVREVLEDPVTPFMAANVEVPGVDTDAIQRLLRIGVYDQRDDGADGPSIRECGH